MTRGDIMSKYFKGNIINVNNLPDFNYDLNIVKLIPNYEESYHLLNNTSDNAFRYYKDYSSKDLKKLVELIRNIITKNYSLLEKQELDETMKNIFSPKIDNNFGDEIFYEKIYDENGNAYGKELITGVIFPINLNFSSFDVNYSEHFLEKVYYDFDKKQGYYLRSSFDDHGYNYFLLDFNWKSHNITGSSYSELDDMSQLTTKEIFVDSDYHKIAVCDIPISFEVCLSPKMTFSPGQRIEYVIGSETIANELEVNNYVSKFENGLGRKRRKKKYEVNMNNLALSNYLGEINFTSNAMIKERINESALTKEMKELEFLLLKLKSVSKEDYEKLNSEYLELLNQNNDDLHVNTLSLSSIISLQDRAELAFVYHGGDAKKIITYLESHVNEYINNYKDGFKEKNKLTVNNIDRLCEYFLNNKNSFTIKEQNEILRCLSLLYFFEIYENKDKLTSHDLENSYVVDNIKRVLVVIGVLHDEGIIMEIPNNIYDINNLDGFLDYIRKIKLNDTYSDNGISLIKKIQQ